MVRNKKANRHPSPQGAAPRQETALKPSATRTRQKSAKNATNSAADIEVITVTADSTRHSADSTGGPSCSTASSADAAGCSADSNDHPKNQRADVLTIQIADGDNDPMISGFRVRDKEQDLLLLASVSPITADDPDDDEGSIEKAWDELDKDQTWRQLTDAAQQSNQPPHDMCLNTPPPCNFYVDSQASNDEAHGAEATETATDTATIRDEENPKRLRGRKRQKKQKVESRYIIRIMIRRKKRRRKGERKGSRRLPKRHRSKKQRRQRSRVGCKRR